MVVQACCIYSITYHVGKGNCRFLVPDSGFPMEVTVLYWMMKILPITGLALTAQVSFRFHFRSVLIKFFFFYATVPVTHTYRSYVHAFTVNRPYCICIPETRLAASGENRVHDAKTDRSDSLRSRGTSVGLQTPDSRLHWQTDRPALYHIITKSRYYYYNPMPYSNSNSWVHFS